MTSPTEGDTYPGCTDVDQEQIPHIQMCLDDMGTIGTKKNSRYSLDFARTTAPALQFVQNTHIRKSEIAYHCYNEDIVLGFASHHQVLFWFGNQLFRWCSKGVRCHCW